MTEPPGLAPERRWFALRKNLVGALRKCQRIVVSMTRLIQEPVKSAKHCTPYAQAFPQPVHTSMPAHHLATGFPRKIMLLRNSRG